MIAFLIFFALPQQYILEGEETAALLIYDVNPSIASLGKSFVTRYIINATSSASSKSLNLV
jgi:hypothetical protein